MVCARNILSEIADPSLLFTFTLFIYLFIYCHCVFSVILGRRLNTPKLIKAGPLFCKIQFKRMTFLLMTSS